MGEVNLSVISARSRNGAFPAGADQVALKRSVRTDTSETASPSTADKTRTFGAGHSAACACISGEERATPRMVGEDSAAVERYRTVGMNYIPLSEYGRSGEGASKRCRDVENDNRVRTGLARRTSEIETGRKVSGC